jgi:hypothetical protein
VTVRTPSARRLQAIRLPGLPDWSGSGYRSRFRRHAAINTAGRFVLPEFANENYQVVWWFMVGLYVLVAVIVTLVAGPKRLVTSIPRRGARHDLNMPAS